MRPFREAELWPQLLCIQRREGKHNKRLFFSFVPRREEMNFPANNCDIAAGRPPSEQHECWMTNSPAQFTMQTKQLASQTWSWRGHFCEDGDALNVCQDQEVASPRQQKDALLWIKLLEGHTLMPRVHMWQQLTKDSTLNLCVGVCHSFPLFIYSFILVARVASVSQHNSTPRSRTKICFNCNTINTVKTLN